MINCFLLLTIINWIISRDTIDIVASLPPQNWNACGVFNFRAAVNHFRLSQMFVRCTVQGGEPRPDTQVFFFRSYLLSESTQIQQDVQLYIDGVFVCE